MKYRVVDWTSCRGDFSLDGDIVIESSLDIHEVAENLLKDRFQEKYDEWKIDKDNGDMMPEGFLAYCCEFYNAQHLNDSIWILQDGEEQSRFLIQENSEFFDYKFPDARIMTWPEDGIFKLFDEHNWDDTIYDFKSLTGIDPYEVGWDGFDCAKVLIDAGVIKETV